MVKNLGFRYPSAYDTNISCSCETSFDCVYPAGVYSNLTGITAFIENGQLRATHESDFILPGMLVGCFPLNVLLQSTVQCLFNATCLKLLQSSLPSNPARLTTPLQQNADSQFSVDTTVKKIIDLIMVEKWESISNYSIFYRQCNPTKCTHSIYSGAQLTIIFAMIISLFGGLSVVLKMASRILVRSYRLIQTHVQKFKREQRNIAVIDVPSKLTRKKFTLRTNAIRNELRYTYECVYTLRHSSFLHVADRSTTN